MGATSVRGRRFGTARYGGLLRLSDFVRIAA